MSSAKQPLSATLVSATLVAGNEFPQALSIPRYHGKAFYIRASIVGTTLQISIDDRGPSALTVPAGSTADTAEIELRYHATRVRWTLNNITYLAVNPLRCQVRLSADYRQAYLFIEDTPTPPVRDIDKDAELGFIVVKDDALSEAPYRMEWIANPALLTDFAHHTTSTVILPADDKGSVGGPMGLEVGPP